VTQFNPSETFVRHDSVLADIDVKQRLIDLIAVPWDQEAEVPWRGEIWHEVFRRGSFDGLEEHVGRVRVNREHVKGDTVGKLVFADPQAESGLITRSKIAKTFRGDETLALAEEDMLSPSVGYRIKQPVDIYLNHRLRMREIKRAFLDHLSLVEAPAYAGAQVLAVREEQAGLTEDPPPETRALDEAWNHPAYLRTLERLTQD
jgi:HK97 family phage prohead protease